MFVGNLSELLMRGLKHYHLGSSMHAQGSVRRKKITHLKNAVSCLPYYRVGE